MSDNISEASVGSAGTANLETRINRLYQLIQETERPGEFRQNHLSGEVKPFLGRPSDRQQVKRWKAELKTLTRRQHDREEATRLHQIEQDRAAERQTGRKRPDKQPPTKKECRSSQETPLINLWPGQSESAT